MTKHALPGSTTKVVCLALAAGVVIFASTLLLTVLLS
jgi:hypothetical protein